MWALCYQPRGKNFATRENFFFFLWRRISEWEFAFDVNIWYRYKVAQIQQKMSKELEAERSVSSQPHSLQIQHLSQTDCFLSTDPRFPPPRLCSACSLHLGYPVPSLPVESLLLLQDPSGFSLILVLFLLYFSYMCSWHFFFTEGGLCELWYHFFPHPWAHSRSSTASCTDKMLTW